MIKTLTFALTLTTPLCWGQVPITGTVMIKGEKEPAPGINIVEKGTTNGTTTRIDGTFELTVSDPNAILAFSFIGFLTEEYPLKGKTNILVELRLDCIKDFFDTRQVHIYAKSGLINNPLGGQIHFASPWILRGIVKGSFGYQTNRDKTQCKPARLSWRTTLPTATLTWTSVGDIGKSPLKTTWISE